MLTQSECWHEILSRHSGGLTHVWKISITFHQSYNNSVAGAASPSALTRGGHLCKLEHYWSICNPFNWGYVGQIFAALNTGAYHPYLYISSVLCKGGRVTSYYCSAVYPVTSRCDGCWQDDTSWHWQVPSSVTYPDNPEQGESEHLVNITCEHIRTWK